MALKPPPEKDKEKKINEFVNKGGDIAQKDTWTMITVRLPSYLLKEIDNETKKRIGLSRNAWILEAFQEKLKN